MMVAILEAKRASSANAQLILQRAQEHVPSEGGLLELLASVETVSELEEAAVILADRDDQVASRVELSERELVVVLVVEDVEEGRKEGVEVLQTEVPVSFPRPFERSLGPGTHVHDGELGKDLLEALLEGLLGELDLRIRTRDQSLSLLSLLSPSSRVLTLRM